MLRKLLKYEFKATGRILLPLYGALLVFALILKIFVVTKVNVDLNFLGSVSKIISIFLYGATLAAVAVATIFIIMQRFYKNLLGDEGYLMHTIPVSTNLNISSKLIASIIWCCFSAIIAILSLVIIVATPDGFIRSIEHFLSSVSNVYAKFGFNSVMISGEFILACLAQIALNITLIYASISLGHLLPKMKILGSFGAFLLLNLIMSIILFNGFKIFVFHTTIDNYFSALATSHPITFMHCMGTGAFLLNAVWVAIFYFITHYILKNKLNLE